MQNKVSVLQRSDSASSNTTLAVLKRTDPNVEEVLATASHVCLYAFDVDAKQWVRRSQNLRRAFAGSRPAAEPQGQGGRFARPAAARVRFFFQEQERGG